MGRSPALRVVKNRPPSDQPRFRRLRILGALVLLYIAARISFGLLGQALAPHFIRYETVNYGELSISYQVEAVVIRDETVCRAPFAGKVTRLVSEGERVAAGKAIIELVSIPTGLPGYQGAAAKEGDQGEQLADELSRIRAAIEQLRLEKEALMAESDINQLPDLVDRLLDLQKRQQKLQDELTLRQMGNCDGGVSAVVLRSPRPGIVSFYLDGTDDRQVLAHLLPQVGGEEVDEKPRVRVIRDGTEVQVGQPLFRLIDSFVFYLVCRFAGDSVTVGENVKVRFPGLAGEDAPAKVIKVLSTGKEKLVVLRVTGFHTALSTARRVPVEVETKSFFGALLPARAICQKGGETGVWVKTAEGLMFKEVAVLGSHAGKAVVEGLPRGVEVVTNPWLVQ